MRKEDRYQQYISSKEWAAKRKKRLEVDNHECQTCCSRENLQVHHRTYERFGCENVNDLLTLCETCHEAITNVIRKRRYKTYKMPEAFIDSPGEVPQDNVRDEKIPQTYLSSTRRRRTKNVQKFNVPAQLIKPSHYAQWGFGKSNEPDLYCNEEDHE